MRYFNVILVLVLLCSCYGRVPEKTGLEGKPIPHFTMLYTDSTTYFSTEHIPTGKATVFVYFGPHCIYSKAQAKDIVKSIDKLKNINFYFICSEDWNGIKQFSNEIGLANYSNVKVGYDYTNFFSEHFEVPVVPFLAIYNEKGIMTAAFEGTVEIRDIKKYAKS